MMTPRRYGPGDLKALPWPMPRPGAGSALTTTWILSVDRELDDVLMAALRDAVARAGPAEAALHRQGPRELAVEFTWAVYRGEALSDSALALQAVGEVVPLHAVQGLAPECWPFMP
jgi:hypothetical protein